MMTWLGEEEKNEPSQVFYLLYPSILQCFLIILCGYVAGRLKLINDFGMSGLNTFISTFSLPSMVFLALSTLDLSSVNWKFLLGVLLSKGAVFFGVVIVALILTSPCNVGRAGIYAIFCTQSNDFALGYPIVSALYSKSNPDFAGYFYLVAPISLVLLNPLGFVMMEIQRQQDFGRRSLLLTCFRVMLNPVVTMTLLGIISNLLIGDSLPAILKGLFQILGSAFKSTALFSLGHRMVGKVHHLKGKVLCICLILVICKGLVMPLVSHEVVSGLTPSTNITESSALSSYAFLYGTIPTAPSVFVFAAQYGIDVDLIGGAIVVGTFLSAPLMFISAEMVKLETDSYLPQLKKFLTGVGGTSLALAFITIVVLLFNKKAHRVPHVFTLCLCVSQCIACFGVSVLPEVGGFERTLKWFLITFGVFSCRIWSSVISIVLATLRSSLRYFTLRYKFYVCGLVWIAPTVIVTGLLLLGRRQDSDEEFDPNFHFGTPQSLTALLLLLFCLTTTVVSVVVFIRLDRQYESYSVVTDGNDVSGQTFLEEDSLRHLGLLLMLTCSMIVGLSLSTWYTVTKNPSGVYIELIFVDGILNFGQGLLVFIMFGLDIDFIQDFLKKRFPGAYSYVSRYGRPEGYQNFLELHLSKCKDVFGFREVDRSELVDWFLEERITNSQEANRYIETMIKEEYLVKHQNNTISFM